MMVKPEPCNARNREWHRCELQDDHDGDHWRLEAGRWAETLTLSGDSGRPDPLGSGEPSRPTATP